MNFEKWYYTFDPDTKNYVNAVYTSEKPDNSTEVDPQNFLDPQFDSETQSWIETHQTQISAEKTAEELIADLTQKMAMMQINQSKTNAELLKQIAEIQLEKGTTNV